VLAYDLEIRPPGPRRQRFNPLVGRETLVRDFFRFSDSPVLRAIVCLAYAVAVNRNNRGRDLAFVGSCSWEGS